MKRKHRRMWLVISALAGIGAVAALVLVALEDSIVFFYGPSEIALKAPPAGQRLRIGGLVVEGSVKRAADGSVSFEVTDLAHTAIIPFLKYAQETLLLLFIKLTHFIEEDRAIPRGTQIALMITYGASESTAAVPENFCLENLG